VLTLLNDPEWQQWSNREIARVCHVNEKTVRNVRNDLTAEIRSEELAQSSKIRSDESTKSEEIRSDEKVDHVEGDEVRTYRNKHGTISTMNTANIGKGTQEETMTPTPVEVSTDDILIAFLSNLEYMNEAQVEAAVKAIARKYPNLVSRLSR
jgi:hypothetical protein